MGIGDLPDVKASCLAAKNLGKLKWRLNGAGEGPQLGRPIGHKRFGEQALSLSRMIARVSIFTHLV